MDNNISMRSFFFWFCDSSKSVLLGNRYFVPPTATVKIVFFTLKKTKKKFFFRFFLKKNTTRNKGRKHFDHVTNKSAYVVGRTKCSVVGGSATPSQTLPPVRRFVASSKKADLIGKVKISILSWPISTDCVLSRRAAPDGPVYNASPLVAPF